MKSLVFYSSLSVLVTLCCFPQDEIHAHEENIERFHKKSIEIQELLQTQEAPLELQVS